MASKPELILKSLLKATGPIPTFVIKDTSPIIGDKQENFIKAAYSELKVYTPDYQKAKHVTNYQITSVMMNESYAKTAKEAARKEGRMELSFIGKPNEQQAIEILLKIGMTRRYRANNRYQLQKAYKALKEYYKQKRAAWVDPSQPDTLGWRVWHWDPHRKCLKSPSMHTPWETHELRATEWSMSTAVRGSGGIHAALMPYDWRRADINDHAELRTFNTGTKETIHGVVERFGQYVLGTEGWRAEWVIIRALKAPNTEIGLALEAVYPEVEVYYEDR